MNGDRPQSRPDDQPALSLSITVCTMGSRRDDLRACLESLSRVRGIGGHEVLIVTREGDDLDDVREAFADRLPLRMYQASSEALSVKRNLASREARGDLVAFLDDDTLVRTDYADALVRSFGPGVDCVAGVLEPIFEVEPEGELRESAFRIGGFNWWRGELRPDAWAGANCAFRREALLAAGPFDERLGAGASLLPWGEDSEMFRRFEGRAAFTSHVVVRHRIQAHRTQLRYVLGRAYLNGKARCVTDYLRQEDFWRRAVVIPVMLAHAVLMLLGQGSRLEKTIRVRRLAGYVVQLVQLIVVGLERTSPCARAREPVEAPCDTIRPPTEASPALDGASRVSVVICTMRARIDDLHQCLDSLARAREIHDQEILLVTRDGDEMEGLSVPEGLPVRLVHSPSEGLSSKRNVGCREASGAVVAYLDDDATVGPDYIQNLRRAFVDGIDCVAGVLEPVFEVRPAGVLLDVAFQIGGFNRWEGRTRVGAGIGANCAFRRSRLLEEGAFDLRLGPGGTYLPWGDDSEMFQRFSGSDRLAFAESVVVHHRIQRERVTVPYVLTRSFRNGRVQCVIDRMHKANFWRGAAVVPWMLLRAQFARLVPRRGLRPRLMVWRLAGYLYQAGLIVLGALPPLERATHDQRGT